jgi:hypothetical protein
MLLTSGLVLASLCVGQPPEVPPVVREYSKRLTFYYREPDPALGPRLLKELLKKENLEHPWFGRRADVLRVISGQLGDIARGKPEIVRAYEAEFAAAPPAGRSVIVRALQECGDETTQRKLRAWRAEASDAGLKQELEQAERHLADPQRKPIGERPPQTPHDLDRLWANFFITGEYAPVARILDVFDRPDAPANATLKRVASWSLGSNVRQHERLAELLKKHRAERPAASQQEVDRALKAAGADKP